MATQNDFVRDLVERLDPDCEVTWKAMFGEHGLWSKGTFVAIVSEDQLFVKPTEAGRAFVAEAGETTEAPPYPGAKDYLLIEDRIDDGPWLSELIARTQAKLPAPRKRKKGKRA